MSFPNISIGQAIFALGALLIGSALLILLFDSILYVFSAQKGRELMGLQAALIHSVFKAKQGQHDMPHEHRRSDDDAPHRHRRKTPPAAETIRIHAVPPPTRRHDDSD